MFTLGINAAYHDSAACLVKDGAVVAAAEEERFTRRKHAKRPVPFSTYELPYHAIDYCLKEAGIRLKDVDHVAYSYDPFLLLGKYSRDNAIWLPLEPSAHLTSEEWESAWDPLFLSSIVNAPRQLVRGYPHHLSSRFLGAKLKGDFDWHFVEHHNAHAASAFYPSPFEEAAILTIDGRGERASTTYGYGREVQIHRIAQVNFPHSIGILYEKVTEYLGFLNSSDEYKVMAMASLGSPKYMDYFDHLVKWLEEGRYHINSYDLEQDLGRHRAKGEKFTQFHFDVACSLQIVLENTVLKMVAWLHQTTNSPNLCIAGGVALNCVMNARIRDCGPFRNVWVQPAAGDAGTALGAALWVDAQQRGERSDYRMENVFLGPSYSDGEIEEFLMRSKLRYHRAADLVEETAELLARNKIIGWFQGKMEFGPRALGSRSILASPIPADMQSRLNEIKEREDFRPVAPVVIEEEAANWFVNACASPFMLFVFDVQPDKVGCIRAIRHVDGTARIQTINRSQDAIYYDLLKAFQRRTGIPILVNTSFNTRGEPIVCTPHDAIECFWTSPLDALAIGPFIIEKPITAGTD
jgi:carbamoyltransferase